MMCCVSEIYIDGVKFRLNMTLSDTSIEDLDTFSVYAVNRIVALFEDAHLERIANRYDIEFKINGELKLFKYHVDDNGSLSISELIGQIEDMMSC